MKYLLLLGLNLIASCSNPFEGRGKLIFRDLKQEELEAAHKRELEIRAKEEAQRQFQIQKKLVMDEIIKDANDSFEDIKPLIVRKCFDCHDANTKLPFYALAFPRINPLFKHQEHGVKALDFSGSFPLKAQGNPPQISLLKSIRNAAIDRTMPLKIYRLAYRSKAINDEDEQRILAWTDPLIQRLEDYSAKYESASNDVASEAHKILEQKCFRCHANGNAKGGFGKLENTVTLFQGKYINKKDPAQSELYKLMVSGEMPPNKREALSPKELLTVEDWLIEEARKP